MKYPEKYKGKKIITYYSYQDADGAELFVVGRTEDKQFPIFHQNGHRHIVWKPHEKNVPYKLPGLLKAGTEEIIYICEGEKDVETLLGLGLVATTNRGGSANSKSFKLWLDIFKGRYICILPDNDVPGEKHAHTVHSILQDVAKAICILCLPGLPLKGDVTDWITKLDGNAFKLKDLAQGGIDHTLVNILDTSEPDTVPVSVGDAFEDPADQEDAKVGDPHAWTPFPIDSLPIEIGEYVLEVARVLSCDPGYPVLPCLVSMGGAIGNSRLCKISDEWCEPSVFWGCLIADNSTVKSPAAIKCKEPIESLEDEFNERYEQESEVYESVMEAWKANSRFGKNGDSHEDAAPCPKKPTSRRIKVDDITVEKLVEILFDNPKGLILFQDELAGWFGSFTRYKQGGIGGTDMPFWLSVFRAETRSIDRKGGNRPSIVIKRSGVSVYGTTQPETVRDTFSTGFFSSGFVARILFAMPPKNMKVFVKEGIPMPVREAYRSTFRGLYFLDGDKAFDRKYPPKFVEFSPAAMEAWEAFYAQWAHKQFLSFGEIGSALAKLEAYCARFAMLFALSDYVNKRVPYECINADHVANAFKMVEWFANEAVRVYSMIRIPTEAYEQKRLVAWVARHGGKTTPRLLQASNSAKYPKADDAERMLEGLVGQGVGFFEEIPPGPKGGRPSKVFRLLIQQN